MAVIRILVCFNLPVPKDFNIVRVGQVKHSSVLLLCEEAPVLPFEVGKVSDSNPPFAFVFVATSSPVPQSLPKPAP